MQNVEPDILPMAGGKRGRFAKVSFLYLALFSVIYLTGSMLALMEEYEFSVIKD